MLCFASFPKICALVIMGSCKYNVLETVCYTKPLFSTCIACGDFTCEDISVCHNHQQLVFFHASMWHHFTSYGPRMKLWYFYKQFHAFMGHHFTSYGPRMNHLTLVGLWSQGLWRRSLYKLFHAFMWHQFTSYSHGMVLSEAKASGDPFTNTPNFRFATVVESGSGHSCIK